VAVYATVVVQPLGLFSAGGGYIRILLYNLNQGSTNPGLQVAQATEYYILASNICRSSVYIFL
jgi:hypothetical protein